MKNNPRGNARLTLLALLMLTGYASTVVAQTAQGPSVADTNKLIERFNAYRNLIASSLKWKASANAECKSVRFRLSTVVQPVPLLAPDAFKANDESSINLQQRSEENSLTQISMLGPLILEAIALDCLMVPAPVDLMKD